MIWCSGNGDPRSASSQTTTSFKLIISITDRKSSPTFSVVHFEFKALRSRATNTPFENFQVHQLFISTMKVSNSTANALSNQKAHSAYSRYKCPFPLVAVFCGLSGVVYLVNDVMDRDADRLHPKKRLRPIASGALPVPTALSRQSLSHGLQDADSGSTRNPFA